MPRSAFTLLMVCVVMSILPHYERLPSWMYLLLPIIIGWRILVFRERIRFPPRWARLIMVGVGFVGVAWHHGTIFGPDAGVALLITAYVFKQLEMYTRRDAFLVVILSYFVLATEFLFSNTLYTALYIFLVLVLITSALIALNLSVRQVSIWKPLKMGTVAVLQAIPLMLILFYLFPRFGPLWEMGMSNKGGTRGLSTTVSPGDIAELSQSTDLAFRIAFQGDIPLPRDRYWRALTFDRFDGRTWHSQSSRDLLPVNSGDLEYSGTPLRYQVYLESTGQEWLPVALWARLEGVKYRLAQDLTYSAEKPVKTPLTYRVTSYRDYHYQATGLSRQMWSRYTSLPSSGNSRSVQMAQEFRERSRRDPEMMSDMIMSWFFKEQFIYTLKPPTLGADTIDEFLFGTRKGFCSHYAGAFVFLMRSAGIPARMVGGYQGGEDHPLGNYLLVHQFDAHAWAEYWVEGKGWVVVDPTAAIAPERIESGSLRETLEQESLLNSPFSALKLHSLPVIAKLRLLGDYVDYLWFKNVVSFDSDAQDNLLKDILGKVTPQRLAILLGFSFSIVALLLSAWIFLSRDVLVVRSRADKAYSRFLKLMARQGFSRHPGEGVIDFSNRVGPLIPHSRADIARISQLYSDIKYANPRDHRVETSLIGDKSGRMSNLESQLRQAVASFKL